MRLTLNRIYKNSRYTIGKLYIDGVYFCNTLEDTDRELDNKMPIDKIKSIKVNAQTAIPKGEYKITLNVVSPRFSKYPFYQEVCKGKLPRLLNVPGFEGILIHVGDGVKGPDLTEGCILVGKNKIKGGLLEGKTVFTELYNKIKNQDLTIEIK